jgi:hypothetical protein
LWPSLLLLVLLPLLLLPLLLLLSLLVLLAFLLLSLLLALLKALPLADPSRSIPHSTSTANNSTLQPGARNSRAWRRRSVERLCPRSRR